MYLWAVVLAVLGNARHYLHQERAVSRFFTQRSYALYVVHYPVLLLTALLLTLTLCAPTLAWTEYGAIYDETDALGSDELSDLGQYTLP